MRKQFFSITIIALLISFILVVGSMWLRTYQKTNQEVPQSTTISPSPSKMLETVPSSTQEVSIPPKVTQESNAGKHCSYPVNMCSTGYECFTSVSGGLGPQGKIKNKVLSGDQRCHNVCTSNADCKSSEQCVAKELQREDVTISTKICL